MTIAQRRMDRMVDSVAHVFSWYTGGSWEQHHLDPGVADFTFGNPQELPLPGLVSALQRNAEPKDKDWFAYKLNEAEPRGVIVDSLKARTGIDYRPEDVSLTAGAFGALGVTIRALADEDDEVIFLSPPWFFYELMIASSGARAVRVRLEAPNFDLDPATIAAAITPRTRAIIVNSPHNPTGRIYGEAELRELASVLRDASERNGRPIVLLSDESYNRIVFDGIDFRSPALDYDATITIYTYGKTTLAPGQRIGFAAMPPELPGPRGDRVPDLRPAAGRRLGISERLAPTRDRRSGDPVDRHQGARTAARPDGPGAARDGLRGHEPRGHVLPDGPLAGSRRPRVHDPTRGARCARAAGHDRRAARLVPDLIDGQRRHGRSRSRGVSQGPRVSGAVSSPHA